MQCFSANTCRLNNVKSLQSDKPTWSYKVKVLYLKHCFLPCVHTAQDHEDNGLFQHKKLQTISTCQHALYLKFLIGFWLSLKLDICSLPDQCTFGSHGQNLVPDL